MPLLSGARLGPYEILGPLGAGGMGEVYRARDSRLGRDVAVKVLPQYLSTFPEVRARFEREAKTVSSLNHPHICTLFDVGREGDTDYLVMELVEGETLAQRLMKGPLSGAEVLKLGAQLADALDRAHRAGVIHRDLKPGNMMLTKSGAKLMDFGLARTAGLTGPPVSGVSIAVTQSPTMAQPLTAEGTIVGTFQYMAPEQLEGREADARSDIWALGCVLYEMATGRRAFEGVTQASLISAIMRDQPRAMMELAPMSPFALERLVKQCLSKDPDDRWQNAGDLRRELEWIAAQGSQIGAVSSTGRGAAPARRLPRAALIAWGILATLGLAASLWLRPPRGATGEPAFLTLPSIANQHLSVEPADLAISPDGRRLAYIAADSGATSRLWVRSFDASAPRAMPETEGAERPFWSPDGRWIAFFTTGERPSLKKVPLDGGAPVTLCEVEWARGGTWGAKDDILFSPTPQSPLFRVSARGGAVTPVTVLDTTRRETSQRHPSFLPDGDHFVYVSLPHGPSGWDIWLGSLRSKRVKKLGSAQSGVTYADPGFLVFERDRKLVAQQLDLGRLELVGDVVPLIDAPPATEEDATRVASASRTGRLVALRLAQRRNHLEWIDRSGAARGRVPMGSGDYIGLFLSPDARAATVTRQTTRFTAEVLRVDLERGTMSRFTESREWNAGGPWAPDGKTIAIQSSRAGHEEIFLLPADGAGEARRLRTSSGQFKGPLSWSPDAKELIFYQIAPRTGFDLFALTLDDGTIRPLSVGPANENDGQVSPNGGWLVYDSDDGRSEIFACSFSNPALKLQVTTAGGTYPRWTRGGREIVFIGADQRTLFAVPFTPGPPPLAGNAHALFRAASKLDRYQLDVTKDGERFLVIFPDDTGRESGVTVLIDWPSLLQR